MLKKNNFGWNENSITAFHSLKQALITTPVLALPNFSKTFMVETDASTKGIRVILMQDKHPIAYMSKMELLAIVYAIQKWGAHLL
uniref:Retrovirus-related Pol polyprotein from transposon 297 family n=1 Tax=Cajanus cajan TaxID=3821 RepID=A0A151TDF2_CAJCA|nr:Retrovirus-related Pol polyprotein from transposon 297 family [Cajanus cajan]